jgi:hypothetical protein
LPAAVACRRLFFEKTIMEQHEIDAIGAHIARHAQPRGDAVAVVVKGMGLERTDNVVKAEWGQPFICPTTGNTILWIERPGVEGAFKVTYKVEHVAPFDPVCGIAALHDQLA